MKYKKESILVWSDLILIAKDTYMYLLKVKSIKYHTHKKQMIVTKIHASYFDEYDYITVMSRFYISCINKTYLFFYHCNCTILYVIVTFIFHDKKEI